MFPIEQMTVKWKDGTEESAEFPSQNVVTFNYTSNNSLPDGALLSYEFRNLQPATRYLVRIEGRNRLGSSNTQFAIETQSGKHL